MCTNFAMKAGNGEVIVARTMDFASSTGAKWGEWKAGMKIAGQTTKYSFKAKYSSIMGINTVSDGQNDQGLSMGTLWLPETVFNTALKAPDNALSGLTLPQVILGTCKTVDDVRKLFVGKVVHLPAEFIANYATIHLIVTDVTGKTIVVEFEEKDGVKGVPVIYENPLGLMTNAPKFPWHLRNLSTAAQFQVENNTENSFMGYDVGTTGFGNNLAGLPADPTPPSRFIRMAVLGELAYSFQKPKDGKAVMALLANLMGMVNVIQGTSANFTRKAGVVTKRDYDYTQWTVLKDLKNYKMYQKTDDSLGYVELVCEPIKEGGDKSELTPAEIAELQLLSDSQEDQPTE